MLPFRALEIRSNLHRFALDGEVYEEWHVEQGGEKNPGSHQPRQTIGADTVLSEPAHVDQRKEETPGYTAHGAENDSEVGVGGADRQSGAWIQHWAGFGLGRKKI